ncbi:MAG: phosphoribosyltransferase [Methylobacillus sp.]|nr:phosphoribosyltransferase [Methylobacillus sp.]
MSEVKPKRALWGNFPDVVIQATESAVKKHPCYTSAKTGDIDAALRLVQDCMPQEALDILRRRLVGKLPVVAAVQAVENMGVNVIPEVMAAYIAESLDLPLDADLAQINRVGHTGSSGFRRLATPALFDGHVERERDYLLVDDFVGQGGTLANLRGYIEQHGGNVVLATVLTGKDYSAKLALAAETLAGLRAKHGDDLENWWRQTYGYGFELLTESEARYLIRTENADKVRAEIAAAVQGAHP